MERALIGTVQGTEQLILNSKGNFDSGTFHNDLCTKTQYYLETISFWAQEVLFFTELLDGLRCARKNKNRRSGVLKNLNKIQYKLLKSQENEVLTLEKLLYGAAKAAVWPSKSDVRKQRTGILKSRDSFMTNFSGFQRIAFKYLRHLYTKEMALEESLSNFVFKFAH